MWASTPTNCSVLAHHRRVRCPHRTLKFTDLRYILKSAFLSLPLNVLRGGLDNSCFKAPKSSPEWRSFDDDRGYTLIPNPAKEEDFDQPLTERVFDSYLAGVLNSVAVGIGYGAGYCCAAFLCGVYLAVFINRHNFRV